MSSHSGHNLVTNLTMRNAVFFPKHGHSRFNESFKENGLLLAQKRLAEIGRKVGVALFENVLVKRTVIIFCNSRLNDSVTNVLVTHQTGQALGVETAGHEHDQGFRACIFQSVLKKDFVTRAGRFIKMNSLRDFRAEVFDF